MPLALDYHKIFSSTEEIYLKFKCHGQTVCYSQHGTENNMCRIVTADGLMMPLDHVSKHSITFSTWMLNRLVKFTIKYTDIKLLP